MKLGNAVQVCTCLSFVQPGMFIHAKIRDKHEKVQVTMLKNEIKTYKFIVIIVREHCYFESFFQTKFDDLNSFMYM